MCIRDSCRKNQRAQLQLRSTSPYGAVRRRTAPYVVWTGSCFRRILIMNDFSSSQDHTSPKMSWKFIQTFLAYTQAHRTPLTKTLDSSERHTLFVESEFLCCNAPCMWLLLLLLLLQLRRRRLYYYYYWQHELLLLPPVMFIEMSRQVIDNISWNFKLHDAA